MLQGKESNAPVLIQIHGVTLVKVHQLQMAIKKGVKLFYFIFKSPAKIDHYLQKKKSFHKFTFLETQSLQSTGYTGEKGKEKNQDKEFI